MTLYQRDASGDLVEMTPEAEAAARADSGSVYSNDAGRDVLLSTAEINTLRAVDIAVVLAEAEADIDAAAERARLRFLTPGSGQALEYQQTGDEAKAAKAVIDGGGTPVATDYPMLKAEMDAQTAAGGSPTFTDIINQVVATPTGTAVLWEQAGSAIKRLRRTGKLLCGVATTAADIRTQAAVTIASLDAVVPPS